MKKQIYKLFLLFFLFLCIVGARAQTISSLQYWFDNDFNSRIQLNYSQSEVLINDLLSTSLSSGLHFLHFRACDNEGYYSPVHSQVIYKLPASATGVNVTAYEYWIDNEFSSRVTGSASGQVVSLNESLNMSSFAEGLHFVNIRAKDVTNRWSPAHTQAFYKLPASATGVNVTAYEYWVDNEFSSRVTGSASGQVVSLNESLNMSSFAEGLHFVHIRAKDVTNRWSPAHTQAFYKLPASATGVNVTAYEYWVDNEFSSRATGSASGQVVSLNESLNMSSFVEGLHFVHIRAKDGTNRWSPAHTQAFYKLPASATGVNVTAYEYWVDNEFSSRATGSASSQVVSLNESLNMSSFSEGLHFVHIRAKDGTNRWSPAHTQAFYKLPASATGVNVTAYEYWVDNEFSSRVTGSVTGQVVSLNESLNMSSFAEGLHFVHIRAKDGTNRWSPAHTQAFYKLPASATGVNVTAYEYWVDNEFSSRVTGSVTGQVVSLNESLNMSSFAEGLHFVHIRAKDGTNRWSPAHTQAFYKLPASATGENKISAYRYWFDDLFGSQQLVDLASKVDVYDLITDIDLPTGFSKGETHIIHFQSKDMLGRWSVVHTDTFIINLSTEFSVEPQTIRVYPNPFGNYLTIENVLGIEIQNLSITDATGRTVFFLEKIQNSDKLMVNTLSNLSSGIYTLRYQVGTDLYRKKLLKL